MAGRILIVDDVATNRIVLKARLAAVFHESVLATTGAEALDCLRLDRPDLVLLDLELPDMHGLDVLRRLRAEPGGRRLPVIVLTACTDPDTHLAALMAGADDVFRKPHDQHLLLARIRSLLRRIDPDEGSPFPALALQEHGSPYDWPGHICLTAFPPARGQRLIRALSPLLLHRLDLLDRRTALLAPPGSTADGYLIDATDDATATAFALLSELRASPDTRHAAIALLTDGPETAAMACDLGADEVILPATPEAELAFRLCAMVNRSRDAATRRAHLRDNIRLAVTDPLTGLFNRRYALRRMGEMSRAAVEAGQPYAVLLADIDRFKQVNDRHGHAAGDLVLTEVARRLSARLSPADLIARIGGEEFLIALPARGRTEAGGMARTLCQDIVTAPILLPSGQCVTVSISIGLAIGRPGTLPDDAVEKADRALLEAKLQGRNRVIVHRSAA
ncbi:diguanylate cyclase [Tabrizicola sp. M-4]|uniref:diguanylate cyclase n=1 Tax=Tabrizicola sp. M-4 TaxID=3055847 RepID=UPI003DA7E144